ncbi:MAG: translation elongation factor 4, partial [Nitrospinota bacterium]
ERIRNFSIVAHIDHGKSTLADRILELTHALRARDKAEQFLDMMDLERERGITIKAQAVRLTYRARDGEDYVLNLIDTPGHVDFSYEVSRSLAASEGVLLVVDASQGVQAQTLANAYLALEQNLSIIPVINKIDLPSADPDRVCRQLEELIGIGASEALRVSAKLGEGVEEVLEAVVGRIPPPGGEPHEPLKALVFDSWFDPYRGVEVMVRMVEGRLAVGQRVRFMSTGAEFTAEGVGAFTPYPVALDSLGPGEVGYFVAGIKNVRDTRVGDTVTEAARPTPRSFPGFREPKPMVFCGLYPAESAQYEDLRGAVEKLRLNDSAFTFEPETSAALGFGFRCGFLGLLHMEIIRERLEREYNLTLIATSPTVVHRAACRDGTALEVDSPARLPDPAQIAHIEEPIVLGTILVPSDYVGPVLRLAQEKRGAQRSLQYLDARTVVITYEFPLGEILYDFYDRLKSISRGYASFDYEHLGHRPSEMVKLDLLLNGQPVDALSVILHRDKAYSHGRALVERMRELIPRQLFEVSIQAAIGSRVIARQTIKPLRKHVTAKCYGGDVTRKRKLLERQKEGKKRMKQVGQVEVPQEAFMALFRVGV